MNNIFLITILLGSLIGGSIFGFTAMGDSNIMNGFNWDSDHHGMGMMDGDNHHMGDYEHHEDCEKYSDECEDHDENYCEHHEEDQQNEVTNLDPIIDQNIQDGFIQQLEILKSF